MNRVATYTDHQTPMFNTSSPSTYIPSSPYPSGSRDLNPFSSSPALVSSSPVPVSPNHTPTVRKQAFHPKCSLEQADDDDCRFNPKCLRYTSPDSPTRRESLQKGKEKEVVVELGAHPGDGLRCPVGFKGSQRIGRGTSALEFLDQRRSGRSKVFGSAGLGLQLSTIDHYPSTLVSSHTDDSYRLPSYSQYDWAPPIACAFSHEAKKGGSQLACVGTEEGGLEFLNLGHSAQWDRENTRSRMKPHNNAIFGVTWSTDDCRLVTSSGDQMACVVDVSSTTVVASLRGHTGSVKSSVWDPYNPNVIATASRDGNIHVYDLRDESSTSAVEQPKKRGKAQPILPPTGGDKQPVNVIKQAHGETGKKPKKGTPIVRSTSRSPTSLLYLPSRPHTLISAGTGDSALKLWDLRMHGSYTTKSSSVALDQSADPGLFSSLEDGTFSRKRSHGISSLVLGKEGDVIYALGTDNRIHTHNLYSLSTPCSQTYSHPELRTTFYTRLSASPCGRYLASGSEDGNVHLWEVGGRLTDSIGKKDKLGVVLRSGNKVEVGGLDWASSGLASCSDDLTVRMWKSNPTAAASLKERPQEATWSWAGRVY